jgi:hypothetical protein
LVGGFRFCMVSGLAELGQWVRFLTNHYQLTGIQASRV